MVKKLLLLQFTYLNPSHVQFEGALRHQHVEEDHHQGLDEGLITVVFLGGLTVYCM
jgi:hypothetical protein